MDDDEDNNGADGEEDNSVENLDKGEPESQIPQERQTIVIDVSLLSVSYLEEYQSQ